MGELFSSGIFESAKLLKKGLNTLNWEIEARSLDGSDMLLGELSSGQETAVPSW